MHFQNAFPRIVPEKFNRSGILSAEEFARDWDLFPNGVLKWTPPIQGGDANQQTIHSKPNIVTAPDIPIAPQITASAVRGGPDPWLLFQCLAIVFPNATPMRDEPVTEYSTTEIPLEEPLASTAPVASKKRGRPRKPPGPDEDQLHTGALASNPNPATLDMSSKSSLDPKVGGRGRGRPRKRPLPDGPTSASKRTAKSPNDQPRSTTRLERFAPEIPTDSVPIFEDPTCSNGNRFYLANERKGGIDVW